MNLSMTDLVTGRFKDFSEALIDGIQYIDDLPDDTPPSNMYVLVQRKDTEIGAYFAIPIAAKGNELPEDITGLAALEKTPILLLRLKVKHDGKLFADVITGETLIERNETAGITEVAVVENSKVLGVKDAAIELLKDAGHVNDNGDRVGGAPAKKKASGSGTGAKKNSGKRGRDRGGSDEEEEGEEGGGEGGTGGGGGGGGMATVLDAMGVERSCLNRSKLYERVKAMNVIFRICDEDFLQRYCGDHVIDAEEIFDDIQKFAIDSSALVVGGVRYEMRKALRVSVLGVLTGGWEDGSTMRAALQGHFSAYDFSVLSLLSFLTEKEALDAKGLWGKGVRCDTGRGAIASALRNLDTWLQLISCEGFEGASAELADSLTRDVEVWSAYDNVLIFVNIQRMLATFFGDLRRSKNSTVFTTVKVTTGPEGAILYKQHISRTLNGAKGQIVKQGWTFHPHFELYDEVRGAFKNLQFEKGGAGGWKGPAAKPGRAQKRKLREEKEKANAAAAQAALTQMTNGGGGGGGSGGGGDGSGGGGRGGSGGCGGCRCWGSGGVG
jgi:uncharacterized membrane protein YgcG